MEFLKPDQIACPTATARQAVMAAGVVARKALIGVIVVSICGATQLFSQEESGGQVAPNADSSSTDRTKAGLLALYDFQSATGNVVKDRAGVGRPLDLRITNPAGVQRSSSSIKVHGDAMIRSEQAPTRLIRAIQRSGAITIEAWIRPADTRQKGPARIVTLSRDGSNRNFTLGQDGKEYDVRLRTSSSNSNGLPSISTRSKDVRTRLTHVAYTRSRDGRAVIYLDGEPNVQREVAGSISSWDETFRFGLANEHGGGRQWNGTFHLVAIYGRALSPSEITRNYQAGADFAAPHSLANVTVDTRSVHFQTKIAPLLADHCLECHDSASRQGGLDLSRRITAFAGGDSGRAIVAGKPAESHVWQAVESDEMPEERTPLSPAEKQLLKQWIEDDAIWTIDQIDPAVYVHGNRESQNWVRRLTVPEYIETVQRAVGVDIRDEAVRLLPPDVRADGFSNTAYNLNVDLKHVEAYATLAEVIVSRMDVLAFSDRFSRRRKFTDKSMGDLITRMGKWLLRGPVDEHEVIAYRGISTSVASTGGKYETAVGLIIEAMLQSPRFIYRIEQQRGDGTAWPVNEYELASRLSYIIWGGPPDQELSDAADDGQLYDPRQVEAHVDRMLSHPRAIDHSMRFISEWLNLSRLSKLQPNRKRFPDWDADLANDMREETLAFFRDVAWTQNRPMSDLLNAQLTFATPRLARHYGLPKSVESDPKGSSLSRYNLEDEPSRGGILTQGSVLTIGGDEASMVTRGLFVMHELLRGVVKNPPPCVDTTPVPTKAGLTQRGVAMQRMANATCGGCHVKFEPLAFGLEKYDGIGAFHQRDEHGNELREDGNILFPGSERSTPFATAAELMDQLASSERVQHSIAWKLTQFALGRPLVASDAAIVEQIHRSARQAGGTYVSLVRAIVMSDLVQLTRTEADDPQ